MSIVKIKLFIIFVMNLYIRKTVLRKTFYLKQSRKNQFLRIK